MRDIKIRFRILVKIRIIKPITSIIRKERVTMATYDIGIMISEKKDYIKYQFSPLIPAGCENLVMIDRISLRSN